MGVHNLYKPAAVVASLKACSKQNDFYKGCKIHEEIIQTDLLANNVFIGTALVNMYAKCSAFAIAEEVFDELPVRNVASWNTLITGYAEQGHGQWALDCFERMQNEGVIPDMITYMCALKACGSIGSIDQGQEIHAMIVRQGLLGRDRIGNALVHMYIKCDALVKARHVFDGISLHDVISWTELITGYADSGSSEDALWCFQQMLCESIFPDAAAFVCILKACGSFGAVDKGQQVHLAIIEHDSLEGNILVGTALMDMYAKCGKLGKAQELFEKLPTADVVAWSALITGYVQHGRAEEAINCFEQMQHDGLYPDVVTFICILKACGNLGAADKAQWIHAQIPRYGLSERHPLIGTSLVDMYVRCDLLGKARQIFDKLAERNDVTWNALIYGYVQQGRGEEALNCFGQMQHEGIFPSLITFLCILKACGSIGAVEVGNKVHAEVMREDLIDKDIAVGIAVVDMYAKCGALTRAQEVFDKLPSRDVVSWNVLIAGYGLLGKHDIVLNSFKSMKRDAEPDPTTFTILLNSCSHAGVVDQGLMYFHNLGFYYCITPTLKHYTCMVDLFGRAGLLKKAVLMIKEMGFIADLSLWHTLMNACRKWVHVEIGRLAFEYARCLDATDSTLYVTMSNIYAAAGMHKDAEKIEVMMMELEAHMEQGCLVMNGGDVLLSIS